MNPKSVIERELRFTHIDSSVRYPVAASLSYASHDPYAVIVTFRQSCGEEVTWDFSRELLDAGTLGPVGIGDVRIEPFTREDGIEVVQIAINNPEGFALLEVDLDEMISFLTQTYLLVPSGTEMRAVSAELDAFDWDSL